MTDRSILALAAFLTCLAGPAVASRLKSQTVEGLKRVCIYESEGQVRLPGNRPLQALRVGVGEPCPLTYSVENAASEKAIPSIARLLSQRDDAGTPVCSYGYLGRIYERRLQPGAICPVNPD